MIRRSLPLFDVCTMFSSFVDYLLITPIIYLSLLLDSTVVTKDHFCLATISLWLKSWQVLLYNVLSQLGNISLVLIWWLNVKLVDVIDCYCGCKPPWTGKVCWLLNYQMIFWLLRTKKSKIGWRIPKHNHWCFDNRSRYYFVSMTN